MAIRLPPSLDKSRHTLTSEVAHARSWTQEERLNILARVCRANWQILAMNPHREEILRSRDPCPTSTTFAYRRFRIR